MDRVYDNESGETDNKPGKMFGPARFVGNKLLTFFEQQDFEKDQDRKEESDAGQFKNRCKIERFGRNVHRRTDHLSNFMNGGSCPGTIDRYGDSPQVGNKRKEEHGKSSEKRYGSD